MIIVGINGAYEKGDVNHPNKILQGNPEVAFLHDGGCTLFVDGKHICSLNEERLSRQKYDGNYPQKAIDYCLDYGKVSPEDVDIVYYVATYTTATPFFYDMDEITQYLRQSFPTAEIRFCGHHLAHAASSVFTSPFNEGTFLTLDGGGSALYHPYRQVIEEVENNSIGYFNKEKRIFRFYNMANKHINNLGNYYSHVSTSLFGWKRKKAITSWQETISSIGKIMGLSAYGSLDRYEGGFKDGFTVIKHSIPYVSFPEGGYTNVPDTPEDGARWLQQSFEDGMLCFLSSLREYQLDSTVCFAGGTFLNILANTKIKQSGIFDDIHIPPFTDDAGLHVGAALWGCFEEKEDIQMPDNIALLGREYSNDEIKKYLDIFNLKAIPYDEDIVASKIEDQKIIGWFQGRSEHGPRALGSRSIFMSPARAENKDILNKRVKHREHWRPFAGIIREEDVGEYFEEEFTTPHMLYSQTSKSDKIPAITHVDKTCRIQTVTEGRVYDLLGKLEVPVILNTSFNDNGEPIVETPYHAIKSFLAMDIDCLVIGDFIVDK